MTASRRLPVIETIYKAFAYTWWLRRRLATALLPTFGILAGADLLSQYLVSHDNDRAATALGWIAFPVSILYVITVHRVMLLAPDATRKYGVFRWGRREWHYLLMTIFLSLIAGVAIALWFGLVVLVKDGATTTGVGILTMWLPVVGLALIFSRIAIVLPAIAVDDEFSITGAWEATRTNTIRIFIVIFSVPILCGVSAWFLYALTPQPVIEQLWIPVAIVTIPLSYLFYAIEIACLSFVYRYFLDTGGLWRPVTRQGVDSPEEN